MSTVVLEEFEAAGREMTDVNGWHGVLSPRCPQCGEILRFEFVPRGVIWNCPGCIRWAWSEPPGVGRPNAYDALAVMGLGAS